ncbi:MAG: hypothetical protein M1828_000421 [Chrysothrix sp. TS-e1954]|nr:MAG: hypothetical protein M1828_000421 [Chrysothrix sp. TS-e1954]
MSTSEDEEAAEPKGGARGTGKYKDFVPRIDGQQEDFVLPSGATACPVKHCSRYMKVCHPHWRLNEHMKTRHGWPRKNTQRHTDRRLSGAQRSGRYAGSQLSSGRGHRKGTMNERKGSGSSGLSSPNSQVFSPQMRDISPEPSTSRKRIPKKSAKLREHQALNDGADVEMDDTQSSELDESSADHTRDEPMIVEIERFIAQLESNGSDNTSSERSQLIQSYKDLIADDMIKVNCTLPKRQALRLMTLYKELSRRAEQQNSVYEMGGSHASRSVPARPILKPRGRPSGKMQQKSSKTEAAAHTGTAQASSSSLLSAPSTSSNDAQNTTSDPQPPPKKLKLKLNLSPRPKP